MKIALVNKFYPPVIGGIEYHVRLLAENLAKYDEIERIEIIVANDCNKLSQECVGDKIFITRLPNWKTIASTPIAPSFIRYLQKLDVDLVHFHFPYPFGDFAWLLAGVEKPFVITYHSDILRQKIINKLYAPIRDRFFLKANKILATSPRLIDSSPVLNKFRDKTIAVPLGIDPQRFLEQDGLLRAAELRKKYDDRPIVLFVGRLVYYKGVEVLIEAFRKIDANLIMIGKGILEDKLKNMVHDYQMDEKVFFYTSVDDDMLTAYFHACDVFVLPSVASTEAYGLVQLEAQACGKPVISTNLPTGVPYVNQDTVTGLVVEPGNVEQLAQAIATLVDDGELRSILGQQAKKRMLAEFTDKKMTQRVVDVYSDVLNIL